MLRGGEFQLDVPSDERQTGPMFMASDILTRRDDSCVAIEEDRSSRP